MKPPLLYPMIGTLVHIFLNYEVNNANEALEKIPNVYFIHTLEIKITILCKTVFTVFVLFVLCLGV